MSPDIRRVMPTGHLSNKNKRDMLHYLLVHLHQGTDVSSTIGICKISKLDPRSLKVVWHKEVMELLDVLSVVGPTQKFVVMAPLVASSVIKIVTL